MKKPLLTWVDGFGRLLSFAARLSVAIGSLVLLTLALIGFLDVFTTRFLHQPIPGARKLSEALLAAILFLGLVVATGRRRHVRVDMLVNRLGRRARLFSHVVGYPCTTIFFALWTWQMGHMAAKSWAIREITDGLLPYPVYPIKCILFLGLLFATMASFGHLLLSFPGIYHLSLHERKG